MTNCENKMINESENPLVTPDFIGTDEEKMSVLSYWSELIGMVRSLNAVVISHENKLAILTQIQKEIALLELEVNNVSAHPTMDADGMSDMAQDPEKKTEIVINLGDPEEVAKSTTIPTPVKQDQFARTNIPTTEMMQRLAGNWYTKKPTDKK